MRYDDLRTDPRYYWADWSQDGCSSPDWVPDFFTMDYPEACLRHDLTWRTLPVIDDGTRRVWNERNRWVADEKFRDDSLGAVRLLVSELAKRGFTRDSPDQTTFPGYSSRGDTAKYNAAFQGRQMRSDAA